MKERGERDTGKDGDRKSPGRHDRVKLKDLEVSENQSSRWAKLSDLGVRWQY
jgi:hypothetical protein